MITKRRFDALLRSAAKAELVDICEAGGAEGMQYVVTLEGGGEVDIYGCAAADGEPVKVATVTVPAGGELRENVQLGWPQYVSCGTEGAVLTVYP